jgi:hypothetical protein
LEPLDPCNLTGFRRRCKRSVTPGQVFWPGLTLRGGSKKAWPDLSKPGAVISPRRVVRGSPEPRTFFWDVTESYAIRKSRRANLRSTRASVRTRGRSGVRCNPCGFQRVLLAGACRAPASFFVRVTGFVIGIRITPAPPPRSLPEAFAGFSQIRILLFDQSTCGALADRIVNGDPGQGRAMDDRQASIAIVARYDGVVAEH